MLSFGYTARRKEGYTKLMDYNARFYSPRLGRFISADSIVPNPVDPLSFDRFSYVRANPIKFSDPTGHAYYDPGCDCMVYEPHPPTPAMPDILDDSKLFDEWTSSETKVSGQDNYWLYKQMWSDKTGWWWSDPRFGGDGVFDVWDFIALILFIETGEMANQDPGDPEKGYQAYIEGAVRASQEWCDYMGCDASTPEGALNWLAGYSQSGASLYWDYKNGVKTLHEAFPKIENHPADMALEIVYRMQHPGEWATGWEWDRPYGVGNASLFDENRLQTALDLGLADSYLEGNSVIIPIGCGAWYLSNDQNTWNNYGCGDWPDD